jgi:hypothetical protein
LAGLFDRHPLHHQHRAAVGLEAPLHRCFAARKRHRGVRPGQEQPPGAPRIRNALGWWWHTPEDLIDKVEAQKRLDKEITTLDKDIAATEKKLGNADFVARAPEEIVEENRDRLKDWALRREKLKSARAALAGIA